MNYEDECGRDQEAFAAPEFSDTVAAESSGSVTSNSSKKFKKSKKL